MDTALNNTICLELSRGIPLETPQAPLGKVEIQPLSKVPRPLDVYLKAGQAPVYIEEVEDGFCAYPVRVKKNGPSPLASERLFSEKIRTLPSLFGKPTLLRASEGEALWGVLFDPQSGLFYAPDTFGIRWYLIGDKQNYSRFRESIVSYFFFFADLWDRSPERIFANTWNVGDQICLNQNHPGSEQAWKEMERFSNWLLKNNPELALQVMGSIDYSTQFPEDLCPEDASYEGYAYSQFSTGLIYLLPRTIHLLEAGDYPSVAEILTHEISHLENYQLGLAPPSRELMVRAIDIFLDSLDSNEPFLHWNWELLLPTLRRQLLCAHLPVIPEEETAAYDQELTYSEDKDDADLRNVQREALEGIDQSRKVLTQFFPPPWKGLAEEYLQLAHQTALKNSLIF